VFKPSKRALWVASAFTIGAVCVAPAASASLLDSGSGGALPVSGLTGITDALHHAEEFATGAFGGTPAEQAAASGTRPGPTGILAERRPPSRPRAGPPAGRQAGPLPRTAGRRPVPLVGGLRRGDGGACSVGGHARPGVRSRQRRWRL